MKEFIYGSCQAKGGYGLIAASVAATLPERNWVRENSAYLSADIESESYSFSCVGNVGFLTKAAPATDYTNRKCSIVKHLCVNSNGIKLYDGGPVHILKAYQFADFHEGIELHLDENVTQIRRIPRSDSKAGSNEYRTWRDWYPKTEDCMNILFRTANALMEGKSVLIYYKKRCPRIF